MFKASLIVLLSVFASACTMVPVGPSKDEKASKINVQLGVGYYQQGNLEQANEKLLKALRQDPENSQAHYAYAVLQHRFLQKDKAEEHFRKAIELDPTNSDALTNFGALLCNEDRIDEATAMFMQAVKNPLYRSPEVAYTNAAVCLLKKESADTSEAEGYLHKALAAKANHRLALINLAEIMFAKPDYELTKLYLKRFDIAGAQTARSLWLEIQNELALGNEARAYGLGEKLKNDFPQSTQLKSWLELSKK